MRADNVCYLYLDRLGFDEIMTLSKAVDVAQGKLLDRQKSSMTLIFVFFKFVRIGEAGWISLFGAS